jgi:hypothetical protein
MPHLEIKDNALAGTIIIDAKTIKTVLESQLQRLVNGETVFDSIDFQRGVTRSLIEAFSLIHDLAKITQSSISRSMISPGGIGTPM